jgi:nucleoside phosphorylase
MAANGAGPARAALLAEAALRESQRRSISLGAVASVGLCGALDPALRVGDIVVGSAIHGPAGEFDAALPESDRSRATGPVASIAHVAQTADEKARLRASGAVAVEMEAAGIAPIVRQCKIRLFCIRSVSDLAEESFSVDLNRALRPDGRFSAARILLSVAARPLIRVPELWRLKGQRRAASEALGDFIASCRF